jgi:MoaA/NifB/PqqE/SkfB family radical SAM enzyme
VNLPELFQLSKFFIALSVKEHLRPELHVRPLVAECFITDNCNLRCISCACWRETTRNELSTSEWKNVLNQLAAISIYKVNFTGGEPLLRRDALELMHHANSMGIRHIHLNTNAILLKPARLVEILAAGVRSFNISIDGIGEKHDLIRGKQGAYGQTIDHLRYLIAQRDRYRLKIRMAFTVMRENVASLPAMAFLAQELGVQLYLNLATDKTFLFRDEQVSEQARVPGQELRAALAHIDQIARQHRRFLPRYSDLNYVPKHFSDIVQRQLPCAESQLKLMIHSRGEVGGCWAHDPQLNVRDLPLKTVIDGEHYRQEHARLFRKECVGCGSNYSLNLRWRPSSYINDWLWKMGLKRINLD